MRTVRVISASSEPPNNFTSCGSAEPRIDGKDAVGGLPSPTIAKSGPLRPAAHIACVTADPATDFCFGDATGGVVRIVVGGADTVSVGGEAEKMHICALCGSQWSTMPVCQKEVTIDAATRTRLATLVPPAFVVDDHCGRVPDAAFTCTAADGLSRGDARRRMGPRGGAVVK